MNGLLRHTITGQLDGAPTVLLSAGMGGQGGFWRPQMAALEARYRVIRYDQNGTGENTRPLPEGYSVSDMADEVAALLAAAGEGPVHFVGHAFGGLVGLELALRHPGRLRSVVPVNSWLTLSRQTARCFAARLAVLAQDGPEGYLRAQPIFLYPATWLHDHEDEVEREVAAGLDHFQGEANLKRRIAALRGFDIASQAAVIETPALAVCASDDVLVPVQCSHALSAAMPNATLFEMTGGHSCTVTAPDVFNTRLMAFIDGIEASAAGL